MLRFLIIILRSSAYFVRMTAGSGTTISSEQRNALKLRRYTDIIVMQIENHLCWIMSGKKFSEPLNRDQLVELASGCQEHDCTCSQALDVVVETVQAALEPGHSGYIKVEGSIEEGVPVITAHPPKI